MRVATYNDIHHVNYGMHFANWDSFHGATPYVPDTISPNPANFGFTSLLAQINQDLP